MPKISGHCLCGSVKYSCDEPPLMTAVCHCENCQRQTGTAFSVIVGVPAGSIVFENDDTLAEYVDHGESGRAVRRQFCKNCGSPIVSILESALGLDIIKAGTLNDKSWLKPTTQFWCDTAQPWVELDETMDTHGRNPS